MIALIKGCGNNIASLLHALKRLGFEAVLTDDVKVIQSASHVILPGVGQAARSMNNLRERGLDKLIPKLKKPVLGICIGMQLLHESTEEGNTTGLGIFPGVVKKIVTTDQSPVPHMGWNNVYNETDNFGQLYFVHSYAAPISKLTTARCNYNGEFSAIVRYRNFIGMQFHPEKSGKIGEFLLQTFLTTEKMK